MQRQISRQSPSTKLSPKNAKAQPKYYLSPASHGRYIIHIAGMRYIFDTEAGSSNTMLTGRSS